jgi:hypothetical protein
MGLGFLLDSQAVLLLGMLLTPLMTPWVGFLLAILTGNPRFFFETMMALLISASLVFIGGLVTGLGSRLFMPITLTNVFIHARLWIPELVVLAIGAATLVASFVRSEEKPYLPSVVIAYAFFLPVNAAGFGLGSGLQGVWQEGLLVFLSHLALASLIGLFTLLALKFRPSSGGLIFSSAIGLLFVLLLFRLMGPDTPPGSVPAASPTPTPTTQPAPLPTLSPTSALPPSPTSTPATETATALLPDGADFTETVAVALTQVAQTRNAPTTTPTLLTPSPIPITLNVTLPASETPTVTLTIEVQPIYGRINASEGGGANLRQTPNGKYLMTLDNGSIVEIYPDFKQVNGVTWIHVFATRSNQRIEGWLLESVVVYATPQPNFVPSPTPGVTQAP